MFFWFRFDRDLRWRTGVQLLPVHSDSSNNFKITVAAMEEAYNNAAAENIRVKGVLITNPSNPLGTILDRETLIDLVTFVNSKNIHLVCDEIYAATVFTQPDFVSVAEVIDEIECNTALIHIVYSLSKDLGLPGFRVGIVYSYNDAVMNCARKMSSFGLVSTQTQRLVAGLLSDDEFVNRYIFESADRLALRHQQFTSGLAQVGIGCLESNSGLFLWMDLHKMLKDQTFESEMELWRVIVNEVKLNVSPGQSFHSAEPGWFRVCFANMDDEVMEVALRRIRTFVAKSAQADLAAKKRRSWQNKLNKLSFKSRILDDVAMSPGSPMPHSPMLRAQN
uniref:1-aminocyclopropane-1-carboxylate synthase n=1 Tax=Kalanchoe fedtschenkoi TaxID=63787 RepID=A0A7N1A9K9_KALFE